MAMFSKKPMETIPRVEAKPLATPPDPKAVEAPAPDAEAQRSQLVVGPDIRLTGSEIADCDTVIIEGRVEATVDARVMQITECGTFSGKATLDMAEIRGRFEGDLTVHKRLTVCGTGKVKGTIRYGTLVVEEGGELSGDVDSHGAGHTEAAGKPEAPKEGKLEPMAGTAPANRPEPLRVAPPRMLLR